MRTTGPGVRVTAKQLAAMEALLAKGRPTAEDACLAVLTAEDATTRWCVVTVDPKGNYVVFGPYATSATAIKVAQSGIATAEGTRGKILPLVTAPKKEKR